MSHRAEIRAIRCLLESVFAEFPELALFGPMVVRAIADMWELERALGDSDRAFFRRYATPEGTIGIAGWAWCTLNGVSGCDAAATARRPLG